MKPLWLTLLICSMLYLIPGALAQNYSPSAAQPEALPSQPPLQVVNTATQQINNNVATTQATPIYTPTPTPTPIPIVAPNQQQQQVAPTNVVSRVYESTPTQLQTMTPPSSVPANPQAVPVYDLNP